MIGKNFLDIADNLNTVTGVLGENGGTAVSVIALPFSLSETASALENPTSNGAGLLAFGSIAKTGTATTFTVAGGLSLSGISNTFTMSAGATARAIAPAAVIITVGQEVFTITTEFNSFNAEQSTLLDIHQSNSEFIREGLEVIEQLKEELNE